MAAPPPRPRQMAGSLRGDDRVRLHSLQGAAQQHNGAAGHLRSWNAGTGRWDVKLSTGPELSVRPTNLTTLCSRPGCAIGETEARLKSCARCKEAAYCSKECQVAAWKGGHKKVCKPRSQEISEQLRGLRSSLLSHRPRPQRRQVQLQPSRQPAPSFLSAWLSSCGECTARWRARVVLASKPEAEKDSQGQMLAALL